MLRKNTIILAIIFLSAIALGCMPQESATVIQSSSESTTQPTTESEAASVDPKIKRIRINVDEKGVALRGYDPVTYFVEKKAVKGQEEFNFSWNNAQWHFASVENRDKFAEDPEKYAPANGGFCTFGIVLAKKLDGDPEVWSLLSDRLYVFLNEEVKEKFLQDVSGNLETIKTNWPKIEDKPPEEL